MAKFIPRVKKLGTGEDEKLKLSYALSKEGRFDEALIELEAVVQTSPKSIYAYLALGNIYLLQRRYDEALIQFQTITKLDPLLYEGPLKTATVHLRIGNF